MSRVTIDTVQHVARLARLSLTEAEAATFTRQLDQILEYAQVLQALDTEGIPPMSQAVPVEAFRDDAPHASLPIDAVLAEAPDAAERLFRVPRVIG
jgi:aspartyl-tRNA(Asn)/glutamyl-tRNA(Gln) amidotransferase subunit C